MKNILCSIFSAGILLTANAYGQSPSLEFGSDGEFKIVQFTDVHFKYGNPKSDIAIRRINEVLDKEQPDLVIFTGDVIYSEPADSGMTAVLACVSGRKIPFAVTFGNHDDEQGMSRPQLYDLIRTFPYNIQPDRGEAESPDYVLEVKSRDGDRTAALLYCLDSHSYSTIEGIRGYGWLSFEQIEWYRRTSRAYTSENHGSPLPALAFFHIPLPEYNAAAADENAVMYGTRMEKACAPELNSGMFAAMKESGDIMGIFTGHDHDNDYTVLWKGILLGYGRYTGGDTVYNHLPNGARVIVLKEGCRTFTTWTVLAGGETKDRTVYPDSYLK